MRLPVCILAILALCASVGWAAPEKTEAQAPASPAAEFAKLNSQFKLMVSQLNKLHTRYQSDPTANKPELEAEFTKKIEQIRGIEVKLAATAEAAYLADPGKKGAQEYLFAYLASLLKSDRYEDAARLTSVLSEHGYQHKFFPLLAGMATFATMDFDAAKKYLTQAKESNELDAIGQRYLEQIETRHYADLWKREQQLRTAEDKAGNLPRVKLNTSKGDIVVALLENEAPIATANFISLVESKFFDGLKFHRVIPGFMAQGGDPKGDGTGGPGYTIPDECYEEDHRNHFRGSLSMANSGQRDSGGSQFFLTFTPVGHLDGKHTVFGRVIEGMDVLAKLERCQPGDSATPDHINKATVLYKRNHRYEPIKRPDKQ